MEENSSILKKSTKYLITLILIAAIAAAGFFYYKYQQAQNNNSAQEVKTVVNEVSQLMVLPNETPTLATVNDPTQLTTQQFFSNSKVGDKVLIYLNAKEAILYRPSINKIINVAPVNTVGSTPTPTPLAMQTGTPTVAIYNGTAVTSLASKVESEIQGKVSGLSFAQTSNAVKKTYTQTLVVDLSGKYSTQASQIAAALGGSVASLPSGETQPNADILVIAGKDNQ